MKPRPRSTIGRGSTPLTSSPGRAGAPRTKRTRTPGGTWRGFSPRGRTDELRPRRDRDGRRLARRALRGTSGRGRAEGGGRRAGTGGGGVLLLGVHPLEDAASPR